jgi:hypothetical protein
MSECHTGVSDDDDDDDGGHDRRHGQARRPLPSAAGTVDIDDGEGEDFAAFAARVKRLPPDGVEHLASGLVAALGPAAN